MKKLAPVVLAVVLCAAVVWKADWTGVQASARAPIPGQAVQTSAALPPAAPAPQALNDAIKRFCGNCHNDDTKKGELSLDGFDVARAAEHPEIAEKMVRKLRTGLMPPKTARQPDRATRAALAGALESALDAAAATNPNPGRRVFQRLNRAEYTAAVRALFGIDIDVSSYLPADTISATLHYRKGTSPESRPSPPGGPRSAGASRHPTRPAG